MDLPYWKHVDWNLPLAEVSPHEWLLYFLEDRGVLVRVFGGGRDREEPPRLSIVSSELPDTGRFDVSRTSPGPRMTVGGAARLVGFRSHVEVMAIPPVHHLDDGGGGRLTTTIGSTPVAGEHLLEFAKARLLGERPDLTEPDARRRRIIDRVLTVIEEYTVLKLDVAYRIENSALFDPAVPMTHALEVALVRWEAESATLESGELDALAAEAEIAYAVARDHAETVGFRHLPNDKADDARRAAKAVRLAEGATTDGERMAAQAQAVRILESLALYYLPTPEALRKAITRWK